MVGDSCRDGIDFRMRYFRVGEWTFPAPSNGDREGERFEQKTSRNRHPT